MEGIDSTPAFSAFSVFNTDPKPVTPARKGFYYRAYISGTRLYFSENEIVDIIPGFGFYTLKAKTGGEYKVQSSVPDETQYEAPSRPSMKGDHYFHRS